MDLITIILSDSKQNDEEKNNSEKSNNNETINGYWLFRPLIIGAMAKYKN